ncbi:hypothetical protein JCM1841_002913 [Sporobolomyces salmonicolor]
MVDVSELPAIPVRRGIKAFYAKPVVQVCLIAFTCFCCPGMFNALSGIGGGGQQDATTSNNGSVALYSTFAVTSFFSGTINNRLGARLTLSLGAAGYALYVGSFLSYNINANGHFVVAAGAILGVCAGMLWTAQGSTTLAYATEQTKGRLFATFWMIFNLGAVLGSAIELGLTYHSNANTVSNSVYAAFLVITSLGAFIPLLLVAPGTMVRSDGTRVIVPVHPSWKSEFIGLFKCLRNNPWIVLLFPFFLASNWFYEYQFNVYNGAGFTLRSRSLNSMLYYGMQIIASLAFGAALDSSRFRRITKAWAGLALVTVLVFITDGFAYYYQKDYTRATVASAEWVRLDFSDGGNYARHLILYMAFGATDAIWQMFVYWIMGALSNDPAQLAYFVGFYKAIQSAGAAGVFRMDSNLTPYMTELAVLWALCAASILFVAPVIHMRVKDHTEEPVVFADAIAAGEADAVSVKSDEKRTNSEVHEA